MQEFGTMCTERDTESVKGVLPYWPRIFCKISLVSTKTLLVYLCCVFFGWSHGDCHNDTFGKGYEIMLLLYASWVILGCIKYRGSLCFQKLGQNYPGAFQS